MGFENQNDGLRVFGFSLFLAMSHKVVARKPASFQRSTFTLATEFEKISTILYQTNDVNDTLLRIGR